MSDAEIEHWGGMITNTGSLRQFNVLDTENGKEIACTHLTGEGISENPCRNFLRFFSMPVMIKATIRRFCAYGIWGRDDGGCRKYEIKEGV